MRSCLFLTLLALTPGPGLRAQEAAPASRDSTVVRALVGSLITSLIPDLAAADSVPGPWVLSLPGGPEWTQIQPRLLHAVNGRDTTQTDQGFRFAGISLKSEGPDRISSGISIGKRYRCVADAKWGGYNNFLRRTLVRDTLVGWQFLPQLDQRGVGDSFCFSDMQTGGYSPPQPVPQPGYWNRILTGVLKELQPQLVSGIVEALPAAWLVMVEDSDPMMARSTALRLQQALNGWDQSSTDTLRHNLEIITSRQGADTVRVALRRSELKRCDSEWYGTTLTVTWELTRGSDGWSPIHELGRESRRGWCE